MMSYLQHTPGAGFFLETQFTGAFFFDVPNGKATVKVRGWLAIK
jgi:hypothetical protein